MAYTARVPLTLRVLIGLAAGLLVGLALVDVPSTGAATVISVAATVGALFINLIRMTVIPLVVSMLIASIGSVAASRTLARVGWQAAVLALGLLAAAAVISLAIAQPVLSAIPIDLAGAMAPRTSAVSTLAATRAAAPSLGQWVIDQLPCSFGRITDCGSPPDELRR